MAKQKYPLNENEVVVYKVSCVRHGFWGIYTNTLVVTNQRVILEKLGTFGNFKGINEYYYKDIWQAIKGQASNGEDQLELYLDDRVEDFAIQGDSDKELAILVQAINDQKNLKTENNTFEYYQQLKEEIDDRKELERLWELKAKAGQSTNTSNNNNAISLDLNNLSVKGIKKQIKKANKGILGEITGSLLEGLGVNELQDEFTSIGNEFRKEFGLKEKITNAELKELQELENKITEKENAKAKEAFIAESMEKRKNDKASDTSLGTEEGVAKNQTNKLNNISVQLDALKKAKELLDEGILTQEEFDRKKKEIMNDYVEI